MNNLIFRDIKDIYKVALPKKLRNEIYTICHNALPDETGGILIGYYTDNHNLAVINEILGAPSDSESGPTWFYRGVHGVQQKLDVLWRKKKYFYIGEWHYHPNSSSQLSNQDIEQMKYISEKESYNCPEPILLIIGGNPSLWEESMYIFPRGRNFVYLKSNPPLKK